MENDPLCIEGEMNHLMVAKIKIIVMIQMRCWSMNFKMSPLDSNKDTLCVATVSSAGMFCKPFDESLLK